MSVTLFLVPLSIAAIAAAEAMHVDDAGSTAASTATAVAVQSRMRDDRLLVASLHDLGLECTRPRPDVLVANTASGPLTMERDEQGLWKAHFDGNWSEEDALSFIRHLDAAYGIHVQRTVVAKLEQRAPLNGMRVTSRTTDEENTVTLVLEVEKS